MTAPQSDRQELSLPSEGMEGTTSGKRLETQVRYTYRLRPGQNAMRYLTREWGLCRYLWNRLVEESANRYLQSQQTTSTGSERDSLPTFGYAEQCKFLTYLRQATLTDEGVQWLAKGSSVVQQQTVRDFAAARSKAISDRMNKVPVSRRRGMPRFKSRHRDRASMNYTRCGFALKVVDGCVRLRLPGKVDIPVVWSRDLPANPTSARVFVDVLGGWYVSFVVAIEIEPLPISAPAAPIGIDWGVTETATTTSDVYDLPHQQHGKSAAQRLGRYQRMMARRRTSRGEPATKGYLEAKRRAAKVQVKIARQRRDDARKWATRVVRDHDRIAVEDFRPKFLSKSSMARKAADARIAGAKAELIWQATKHSRDLRLVNPAYTTTDCSNCGARNKHRLLLSERIYACDACGLVMPRDKNSAAVMVSRAFGPAITARPGFVPADAEGVRPEPPPRGTGRLSQKSPASPREDSKDLLVRRLSRDRRG